jgi:hypothetical protein
MNILSPYIYVGIPHVDKVEVLTAYRSVKLCKSNVPDDINLHLIFAKKFVEYLKHSDQVLKEALSTKERKRKYTNIRQVVRFVLHKRLTLTLREIGEMTGPCDHTSVIHSLRFVQNMIEIEAEDIVGLLVLVGNFFEIFAHSQKFYNFDQN